MRRKCLSFTNVSKLILLSIALRSIDYFSQEPEPLFKHGFSFSEEAEEQNV